MQAVLTPAQMRAVEAAAIASGAVTGLELMERAGRGVVEAAFAEWPDLAAGSFRAVVLCGPGNNGGDGFVVARLLREWGWEVAVYLHGDAETLPPDARTNYERWLALGPVAPMPVDDSVQDPWRAEVIVDALFGTGLTRPLGFRSAVVLPERAVRGAAGRPRVVAVDVPSGLCADSGRCLEGGDALWADLTVTFHTLKPGHHLAMGPALCGHTVVADIGLGARRGRADRPHAGADGLTLVEAPVPLSKAAAFGHEGHKFTHGHALIVSGGVGRGGAARLAARGALRIGAGLVTVGCPPAALIENAARLDAVMLRKVQDGEALAALLAEDGRINALCLGPGLGLGVREAGLVGAVLGGSGDHPAYSGGLVLDADALTLLSRDAALFGLLHDRCVLTPHGGEFARLFPDIAAKLAAPAVRGPAFSKVDAVRDAARRAGGTILLKGPDTVICDPAGRCSIHSAHYDRAAPWLATAGSGDVLAGFITGLLARGVAPMQAAETAAWLHVECAGSFGPGLIAEDLPQEVPKVLRGLGL